MKKRLSQKNDGLNLVVGAGFSGAVIAERMANSFGEKVVVIDKRSHIGGNAYDYKDRNGILIHKYGSHVFHTDSEKVWKYITRFSGFNTYMHRVFALLDGVETSVPLNLNSLHRLFPKTPANRLECKLLNYFEYNTFVTSAELKSLGDKDFDFLVNYMKRKNIQDSFFIGIDDRYYKDRFQGIPTEGYCGLIENMLKNHNIEVCLNTDYKYMIPQNFKRIFCTGSIDEFFNYKFGMLQYGSVRFELEEHNIEYYQSNGVVNYPNNYDFSRIHEYKHYQNEKLSKTVIAKEYSEEYVYGENERYYPVIDEENLKLYNRYLELAKDYPNLYFLGRLGDYKNYDMDMAVLRALELCEHLIGCEHSAHNLVDCIIND